MNTSLIRKDFVCHRFCHSRSGSVFLGRPVVCTDIQNYSVLLVSVHIKTRDPHCVDRKSSFSPLTSFLIGLFRFTSGYINHLGFCFVLFLTYYSVECQTKSLSNLCVLFIMFPIFLAIFYNVRASRLSLYGK